MDPSSPPVAQIKADLFRALAHPLRIRALELLVQEERSVGELAMALEIDISHLSQQLAVLRRAEVVATRREGNAIYYSVPNPGITALLTTARDLIVSSLENSRSLLASLESDAGSAQ